MKPTEKQIQAAVGRLGCLAFFPSDAAARGQIMRILARMVGTVDQLQWLCGTMVDQVGTWHGPMELRGVFCSRFKPADGVEASCVLTPGFTAMDSEAQSYLAHEERKSLNAAESKRMLESLRDDPPN